MKITPVEADWTDSPGITFRQNCLFHRQTKIVLWLSPGLCLLIEILAWQASALREGWWLLPIIGLFLFLLFLLALHQNDTFVTINETGISCRRKTDLLWAYRWEQIGALRKSARLRNPSVEVVPGSEATAKGPIGERKTWFELGRSAKDALEQYCPPEKRHF